MPKLSCKSCGKIHNFGSDPGRFVCVCGVANEADPKVAAKIAADTSAAAEARAQEAVAAAEKAKADAAVKAEKAKVAEAQLSTPATVAKTITDTGVAKTETAESEKKPLAFEQ